MQKFCCECLGWAAMPVLALCLALLLAGCGGGGEEVLSLGVAAPAAAVPAAAAASAASTRVRLAGCVVDDYFQPRGQTPVRVLGADGRLLGNAYSDASGAFGLQLPPELTVSLAVDKPHGEVTKVATGQHSRALTTCLVDPSA